MADRGGLKVDVDENLQSLVPRSPGRKSSPTGARKSSICYDNIGAFVLPIAPQLASLCRAIEVTYWHG
jgi:hypothetical protein